MDRLVLGIGGYLGAGKSLAGKYFESKGAFFIDADAVVRELYLPNHDGQRKIKNYFGEKFLRADGEVDRAKLGRFVFDDANKLKILNNVIHPLVTSEVQKLLDSSKNRFVALEASYFEPKQLGRFVSKILWIEASPELLLERTLGRPGMTEQYVRNIIRTQQKPEKIDYAIENNGSMESFYDQLERVWVELNQV